MRFTRVVTTIHELFMTNNAPDLVTEMRARIFLLFMAVLIILYVLLNVYALLNDPVGIVPVGIRFFWESILMMIIMLQPIVQPIVQEKSL
jgi:hypothetical protein